MIYSNSSTHSLCLRFQFDDDDVFYFHLLVLVVSHISALNFRIQKNRWQCDPLQTAISCVVFHKSVEDRDLSLANSILRFEKNPQS